MFILNFFLKKIDKTGKKIKLYYITDNVNEGNNNNFIQKFAKPKHGSLNAIKLCKVIVRNQETNKKFVVSDAR